MANNWFPHDASAHNDQRILLLRMKYGWEGYGLYWAMLEAMYETADAKLDAKLLRALCIRFSVTEDHLEEFVGHCVESGLFSRDEEHLYSPRLAEEKLLAIERSKTARQSAERRWKNHKPKPTNANAVQPQSVGNAPPTHPQTHQGLRGESEKREDERPPREDLEQRFKRCLLEHAWCDEAYADKTWAQGSSMDDRGEFSEKSA